MTSLNSFSAASTSTIERRRLATDRRQARGVWLQANAERRQGDRRRAIALAKAISDLARADAANAAAEADAVWSQALAAYERAEAAWSEARGQRSRARALVVKTQARVNELKRH